jgi:acyl-CoA thioesterase-1
MQSIRFRPGFLGKARLAHRSYGSLWVLVQTFALAATLAAFFAAARPVLAAGEPPVKIVALGDSLTAGFELPASAAFPAQLERVLKAKGVPVEIANAGVSGDTATGGLERLDWSVPEGTDAVILELGANDMIRGVDPQVTRRALDDLLRQLSERRIPVLLAGMRAFPNLGGDYVDRFEAIYPDLAAKYGALLYPFFLDGIAGEAKLNQRDGMHPTEAGVATVVTRILPQVEELIARVREKRGS